MSLRSANPDSTGDAGFTLIEALAALGVLATGLAALGQLTASSFDASVRAERHVAEISATREIIAGAPNRNALRFGRSTGSLLAHAWRIDAVPMSTSFVASAASPWRPQGIALLVQSPLGAAIEVDTIRLRKDSAP
jgi:general secretion pathway protein I